MRMRCLSCLVVLLSTSLSFGETLEEIEKKIDTAWSKIKSATTEMSTTMEMSQNGMDMKGDMALKWTMLRKGERMLYRQSTIGTMDMGTMKMPIDNVMICDGEFVFTESKQMGQTMVTKMKAEDTPQQFGSEMFTAMKETNNFKVIDDVDIDGKSCWQIESTPKEAAPSPMAASRSVYFIRKSDAMFVKMSGFNNEGTEFMTMTVTKIELNQKVDPAQFSYTPPEGVTVTDMTTMP